MPTPWFRGAVPRTQRQHRGRNHQTESFLLLSPRASRVCTGDAKTWNRLCCQASKHWEHKNLRAAAARLRSPRSPRRVVAGEDGHQGLTLVPRGSNIIIISPISRKGLQQGLMYALPLRLEEEDVELQQPQLMLRLRLVGVASSPPVIKASASATRRRAAPRGGGRPTKRRSIRRLTTRSHAGRSRAVTVGRGAWICAS